LEPAATTSALAALRADQESGHDEWDLLLADMRSNQD